MARNQENAVDVFKIRDTEETKKDDVVIYCLAGYGTDKDESGKLIISDGTVNDRYVGAKSIGHRHFVKLSVRKEPYDPMKFNDLAERNHQVFAGKDMFTFKEVPRAVFESYIHFLKTKNPVHLEHVKRGLA